MFEDERGGVNLGKKKNKGEKKNKKLRRIIKY